LTVAVAAIAFDPVLAAGPWRAHAGNTTGWNEMTPNERMEHQRGLRSSGSYDACLLYEGQQRLRVQKRGATRDSIDDVKQSACDQLRALGRFE
jgi:hypothetical protein